MTGNIKFSIIVPCYNVEKYLTTCIKSVLKQTYDNWELLMVNDASHDNTLSIMQELSEKDPRILSFDKEHGGPSHTRNFGISHATGDYLVFLDGDDYFSSDHLERDYEIIESTNCDMLIHNQHTYFKGTEFSPLILFKFPELNLSNLEKMEYVFSLDHFLPAATWMVTYSNSFLKNNTISFNDDYTVSEDLDLFMQVISKYPKIEFSDHEFYFYRQDNRESITNNISADLELERLEIYKKWYDFFQDKFIGDFDAKHIQRKLACDLRGEVYICRNLDKEGQKEPKIFLWKNRYLLSLNGFVNSFFFIYFVKYPLRRLKKLFKKV